MSMSYSEARDAMLKVFMDAWVPLGFPAVFTDVPGEVPTTQTTWARATLRHADGGQASLTGPINGCVRWNNEGTIWIQVFAPVGDGSSAAYDAAHVVAVAYQGARDQEVWFRNVRINEVGTRGAFEQINVLIDFTYDDVR